MQWQGAGPAIARLDQSTRLTGQCHAFVSSRDRGCCRKGHQIALDIARGLVFLHKRRIIHADLKSKNILLSNDLGTAKLADVGLSRIMQVQRSLQTHTTLAVTSPSMNSP